MIEATIGVSLVLNYILREHLGVISGGFVVPAYLSIYAHSPGKLAITFAIGFLTYFTMLLLRNYMFLIERRKLMLCLIIGFAYNLLVMRLLGYMEKDVHLLSYKLSVIGHIVPGIIAYWMEEQGGMRTTAVVLINAMLTSMIIMLFFGRIFAI